MFQCFFFFLVFTLLCLSVSSFPQLLDIFKPKSAPLNEVLGSIANPPPPPPFPGLEAFFRRGGWE